MASILCHTNVSEVVSKYPPKPVSNLQLTPGKLSISLTWEDPEDYTEEGYTCTWAKTVVVRKTGGFPNDIHDGTVILTTVERNKYKTSSYIDSNLTTGTTYYYRLFSCNTDGIYGEPAENSSVPINYTIMTVKLNLENSDPTKIGSYADDAVGMPCTGSDNGNASTNTWDTWQKFFGYRPCLFKDGNVVGYLKASDYAKFTSGKTADITSGNAGDVMIEFPRRGIKISKSGKILTVSMTDNPNDPDFKYYAHQRGSTDKDYFYLGSYIGSYQDGKLRSLSGKLPCTNPFTTQEEYAKKNGTGYGMLGYYQWVYIQCMYILMYKGKLNSQLVHGQGINEVYDADDTFSYQSGDTNTWGNNYGGGNYYGYHVKLFGLEEIWGFGYQCVSNLCTKNYHILTTTDDTITDISKYTDQGTYGKNGSLGGYLTDCIGNEEVGFIGSNGSYDGSTTTFFCDYASISSGAVPYVGGGGDGYYNGIFCNYMMGKTVSTNRIICTRLQYL